MVLAGYVLMTGRSLSLKGQNVPVLAAIGILLAVANFLFIVATGIGYLSVTSILGSLSPVVVTAYAQVLLHERLAPRQWAGFAAVFAGIVLLSVLTAGRPARRRSRPRTPGRQPLPPAPGWLSLYLIRCSGDMSAPSTSRKCAACRPARVVREDSCQHQPNRDDECDDHEDDEGADLACPVECRARRQHSTGPHPPEAFGHLSPNQPGA